MKRVLEVSGAPLQNVNRIIEATLSLDQKKDRAAARSTLEMLRVAAGVATVVSAIIFIAHPTIFTSCGVALTAFLSREVSLFALNALEIFEEVSAEVFNTTLRREAYVNHLAKLRREAYVNHLAKDTFTIRLIDRIFQPEWSRFFPRVGSWEL